MSVHRSAAYCSPSFPHNPQIKAIVWAEYPTTPRPRQAFATAKHLNRDLAKIRDPSSTESVRPADIANIPVSTVTLVLTVTCVNRHLAVDRHLGSFIYAGAVNGGSELLIFAPSAVHSNDFVPNRNQTRPTCLD
jgi:hypothetical protein